MELKGTSIADWHAMREKSELISQLEHEMREELEEYDAIVDLLAQRIEEGVINEEYAISLLKNLRSRPVGTSIHEYSKAYLAPLRDLNHNIAS